MSQSGLGNIVSKTHAHHTQSHSTQSAHGNGFMPMDAPAAFAAPFHALVPAGKKKRGPSQILS